MPALDGFSSTTRVGLALIAVSMLAAPLTKAQSPGYSGPGRYQIESVTSGKVLDLDLRDGRTIRQWEPAYGSDQLNPPNNVRNQQWDIEDAGSGFVRIKSAQTGMNLDVQQPNIHEAVPVILSRPGNVQTQLWRLEEVGPGQFKITSRIGKSLDLPNGSRSNGTHLQVFPPNGGDNQKFVLIRIDGRGHDDAANDRRRYDGDRHDADRHDADRDVRHDDRDEHHDADARDHDNQFRGQDNDNAFRGWGDAYTVYCPSDDMGRAWCPADSRFGVRMVRQRSQAPCIEGQTWGAGKRGIWVDRGCRADFRVVGDWQARADALVYCPSDYMDRKFCSVDTRDGVFIVRQRSESDCVYNRTWGYDRDRIWVDRGCRADFEIVDRRDREWREWSRDWSDDDRRGWDRDHDRRDRDGRPDPDRDRDDRPPLL